MRCLPQSEYAEPSAFALGRLGSSILHTSKASAKELRAHARNCGRESRFGTQTSQMRIFCDY